MSKIQAQSRQALWLDDKNNEIPKSRVFPYEKAVEASVIKIVNKALAIEEKIMELIGIMEEEFVKITAASEDFLAEPHSLKKSATLYSFNKEVRLERQAQKGSEFSDRLLKASYNKFVEYLASEDKSPLLDKLVQGAFKTTRNLFDKNKINTLLSYDDDDITSELFKGAMKLLRESKTDGNYKIYYKVSILKDGEYIPVKLNLPSIICEVEDSIPLPDDYIKTDQLTLKNK